MCVTQDGIGLIREMRALHHLQDGARSGMWEIVLQDRNMMLCTQKQGQSDTDYLRAFQGAADAIDEARGAAGVNHRSIELVCNEQKINFADIKIDKAKKQAVIKEAKNRYLAAVTFTGLYNGTHSCVKSTVHNDWILHKKDTLPVDIPGVGRLAASFQEPTTANRLSAHDPEHLRVALVKANSTRGQKNADRGIKSTRTRTRRGTI